MLSRLERLNEMFANMAAEGFDINGPLKWGFYFFDDDKQKLLSLYKELSSHDYKLENITLMDDNKWRLFITKTDILSAEKLHRRNIAFNELANFYSVELYDGWDVEKLSNPSTY